MAKEVASRLEKMTSLSRKKAHQRSSSLEEVGAILTVASPPLGVVITAGSAAGLTVVEVTTGEIIRKISNLLPQIQDMIRGMTDADV